MGLCNRDLRAELRSRLRQGVRGAESTSLPITVVCEPINGQVRSARKRVHCIVTQKGWFLKV